MKLLFLLLAITFYQLISAQMGEVGAYSDVPQSEYENDVLIQRALYSGAYEVVQQGVAAGRLPGSPPFKITKVDRVERQVVAGLNYRFAVELSNGEMTVSAKYVVYQKAGTGELSVSSPSFDITSASNSLPLLIEPSNQQEGIPGGWSPVELTELNTDSNLRDLLNFGAQNAIVQGIDEGNLPDAEYYIEDVGSIEEQVVNGLNYRFNITLGDDEGNEIAISIIVYDQLRTGEKDFKGYEVAEDQGEEEGLLGSWEPVDVSEVDTDQYLREIFDYGLQNVTAEAIGNGLLSNSNYEPSEIYSIKTQLVSGTNYRFNLKLENVEGGSATVIFVVWDEPWTNTRETSYLFLDIEDAGTEEAASEEESGNSIDGGASD